MTQAYSDPKREANARLIAAAPELLAVLKEAELAIVNSGTYRTNAGVEQVRQIIRAAIAKAEGR